MERENTTWNDLLTQFETQYLNNDVAIGDTCMKLGTAIAYSVVKKCLNVTYNAKLERVRKTLYFDTHNMELLRSLGERAYTTEYNEDGDVVKTYVKDVKIAYDKLASETLDDGMDLVQTAILGLYEECDKMNPTFPMFLECVFMKKVYSNVRILTDKNDKVRYKMKATNPIKEVFNKVRKQIEMNSSMAIHKNNMYTYIDDMKEYDDDDDDNETRVYLRVRRYASIEGFEMSSDDDSQSLTQYENVVHIEELIDSLGLTPTQKDVLNLRLKGYGYKAIATYRGKTQRAVAKTCQQIQKKAIECEALNTDLVVLDKVQQGGRLVSVVNASFKNRFYFDSVGGSLWARYETRNTKAQTKKQVYKCSFIRKEMKGVYKKNGRRDVSQIVHTRSKVATLVSAINAQKRALDGVHTPIAQFESYHMERLAMYTELFGISRFM